MEIRQKNIHMEYKRACANLQVPVAEDRIVPDQYPDVDQICFSHAECDIQEVRAFQESAQIRGQLIYTILYFSKESNRKLISLKGNVMLEEKLNMPGITSSDSVDIQAEVEDFRIQLINSRKVSVQAVLRMEGESCLLKDTELPESVSGECRVECQNTSVGFSKLVVSKKDLYRVREEVDLPANYPNVEQCLWYCVDVGHVDASLVDQKIMLKGTAQLFLLYEGEGEDHPIVSYEKKFPFIGELSCEGAGEDSNAVINCRVAKREVAVHPDLDGENRTLHMDVSIDLDIKVYTQENCEVITDIYSVEEEVIPEYKVGELQNLKKQEAGSFSITNKKRMEKVTDPSFQILFSKARIWQENVECTEEGIVAKGSIFVDYLYKTGEEVGYGSDSIQIPYRKVIASCKMLTEDKLQVHLCVEQVQVLATSQEEIEAKCEMQYHLAVFEKVEIKTIGAVEERPLCSDQLGEKPGMCIYVVKEGDTLWEIGKKYATTVSSILEENHLKAAEIHTGDKLILMKEVSREETEPGKTGGVDEKSQIVYN